MKLLANQINLAIIRKNIKKNRGRSFARDKVIQEEILRRLGFQSNKSTRKSYRGNRGRPE
ncbi:MAG UNVERIFIED_CONTAM: hypothetical protein LVQ98_05020 [Rickettsiaceae bacterium]|jgi:RecG-like helicase